RRTSAAGSVGGDLLALSAAADDDGAIGAPFDDGATDRKADRRIVDRGLAVGAQIVDRVSKAGQRLLQMLLQQEAGVIGADSDSHSRRLYYVASPWFRQSSFRRAAKSACAAATHGSTAPTSSTRTLRPATSCRCGARAAARSGRRSSATARRSRCGCLPTARRWPIRHSSPGGSR